MLFCCNLVVIVGVVEVVVVAAAAAAAAAAAVAVVVVVVVVEECYHVAQGGVVDIQRIPHPTVISATVSTTDIRIPAHR